MKKYILITMTVLALTGCGKELYAGSATNINTDYKEAYLERNTEVRWYDGEKEASATINVSVKTGKDAAKLLRQYDTTFIPFDEYAASSWVAINVKPVVENSPQVKLTAVNNDKLTFNGIEYNGNAYRLSDGWYCCAVPNGMTDFEICIGDKKFHATVKKNVETELIEESITETGDIDNEY